MHPAAPSPYPHSRAVIVGETLTLVPWTPQLKPTRLLTDTGSSEGRNRFADIRFFVSADGSREVLVTHDLPDRLASDEREVLARWSRMVGHARTWFSDDFIELGGQAESRPVVTECPVCRTSFRAAGLEFWLGVRSCGAFPSRCGSCGGHLPQWSLEAEKS